MRPAGTDSGGICPRCIGTGRLERTREEPGGWTTIVTTCTCPAGQDLASRWLHEETKPH